MLGTIIAALASAFITGALARFAVPGPDPMPAWLTVVIGLGGTVVGGGIVVLAVGQNAGWGGIASFAASVPPAIVECARCRVPPVQPAAGTVGPRCVSLPEARLRGGAVPRAASTRRHRPRSG